MGPNLFATSRCGWMVTWTHLLGASGFKLLPNRVSKQTAASYTLKQGRTFLKQMVYRNAGVCKLVVLHWR